MARIADFKAQLAGGGTRANQFKVFVTFPDYVLRGALAGFQTQFLCNAAALPASTVENIPVLYRGRPVNFAGERSFNPWTITVYNEVDFNIRNAFEEWVNGTSNNAATNGYTQPLVYQRDMWCQQLDRNGAVLKTYKFNDAYPVEVSEISLGYDQGTAIETFNVTFQYNFWVSNTTALNPDTPVDFSQPITPAN